MKRFELLFLIGLVTLQSPAWAGQEYHSFGLVRVGEPQTSAPLEIPCDGADLVLCWLDGRGMSVLIEWSAGGRIWQTWEAHDGLGRGGYMQFWTTLPTDGYARVTLFPKRESARDALAYVWCDWQHSGMAPILPDQRGQSAGDPYGEKPFELGRIME